MAEEIKAAMIQNQKAATHPILSANGPLKTPALPAPMYPKKSMKPVASYRTLKGTRDHPKPHNKDMAMFADTL